MITNKEIRKKIRSFSSSGEDGVELYHVTTEEIYERAAGFAVLFGRWPRIEVNGECVFLDHPEKPTAIWHGELQQGQDPRADFVAVWVRHERGEEPVVTYVKPERREYIFEGDAQTSETYTVRENTWEEVQLSVPEDK